jgi:hypothetical protein
MNMHLYRYADLLLMLAEAKVETGDLSGAMALVNQVRARAAGNAPGNTAHVAAQGCAASASNNVAAKYPQCKGDTRMVVPMNDSSITWAKYAVSPYTSFPSVTYARAAVHAERRLELALEGQRFFDLRRYGMAEAEATINGYINGIGGGNEKTRRIYLTDAEALADRHRFYPIPPIEIDLSKSGGQTNRYFTVPVFFFQRPCPALPDLPRRSQVRSPIQRLVIRTPEESLHYWRRSLRDRHAS